MRPALRCAASARLHAAIGQPDMRLFKIARYHRLCHRGRFASAWCCPKTSQRYTPNCSTHLTLRILRESNEPVMLYWISTTHVLTDTMQGTCIYLQSGSPPFSFGTDTPTTTTNSSHDSSSLTTHTRQLVRCPKGKTSRPASLTSQRPESKHG